MVIAAFIAFWAFIIIRASIFIGVLFVILAFSII